MATIPLEDNFTDILGKAQRGLKLSDDQLAAKAGVTLDQLTRTKGGELNEATVRKLAGPLNLGAQALLESARQAWAPRPRDVAGLKQFNTAYKDMTVNSYLAWDAPSRQAVAFDTGADCSPALQFATENGLAIKLILLTHTHVDHVLDLGRLKSATKAPAWVGKLEKFHDAQPFDEGQIFEVGSLAIETRQTSGHAVGGMTFVIGGLPQPVAIVGDALFAGSMGGGAVSWSDALENNRRKIFTLPDSTVLGPGHGPLTTVAEEKAHNPFYPEFQTT
jgi:hydroxyacylglutathione hydrolase